MTGLRCFFRPGSFIAWLLTGLLLSSGPALAASLLDFSLPDLRQGGQRALNEFRGKLVVMSFFEPDCRWCYRQMKAFNRLRRECDRSLQPLVVGINGTDAQLRGELRRAKASFPALRASRFFLEGVGAVPATPWTLLLDPGGDVIVTLRGYIPYQRLAAVFADQCGGNAASG